MNAPQETYDELHALVGALCDDAIDASQFARLQRLLTDDVAAQQFYVRYMDLYGALRRLEQKDERNVPTFSLGDALPSVEQHGDRAAFDTELPVGLPLIVSDSSAPVSSFASVAFLSYAIAAVVVGSWLLIASMWILPDRTDVAHALPEPGGPRAISDPTCIARITAMVDCVWEGPDVRGQETKGSNHKSEIVSQKSAVRLGDRLALKSGLLEITYDTGAKLVLQGPVTYEVESPATGYLAIGKLTAKLEKKSEVRGQKSESANQKSEIRDQKSFAIRTPTAIVTDLGTEFGVEVNESGATATHVFRGMVEVQPVASDGQASHAVRLTEDESVRVEKQPDGKNRIVLQGTADAAAFVRGEQVPKLVEERKLKPFRRWQAYSRELRRDSSLLAYYDFQQKPGDPSVLPNVAGKCDGAFDGIVSSATWTAGRMRGKQALLFKGPSDHVSITLPKETYDLTLAAWICVDSLEAKPLSGLLMSTNWMRPGQLHWQISNTGHLVLSCMSGNVGRCDSPPIIMGGQLGRWVHVACVCDHAADRLRFYANGRNVSEMEYRVNSPIIIGQAWIGNWNPDTFTDKPERYLLGRMDELAIFGRPLKSQEIQRMFDRGVSQ
jgi:hypothetical protein